MSDMKREVVLASGNKGKLAEFNQLLGQRHIRVRPQSDFTLEGAEETGLTFIENAILKARHASALSGLPALADDSGLEVDALQGAPGIYSARYAGENASDADNIVKLLEALEGVPQEQRSARFHCVLVYLRHPADPTPLICHGVWEGRILEARKGEQGFGYDPVFYVPEQDCASAELEPAVKNRISHRARALQQLLEQLPNL